MNIFEGDPKLVLTEQGSKLVFKGGQPVMDQGLENLALISLFTSKGWAGNILFANNDEKIGSDFEEIARQPITRSMLIDLEQEAKNALKNPAFGEIMVIITNPTSHIISVIITIEPPGQDVQQLILTKSGANWLSQASNPAHERI